MTDKRLTAAILAAGRGSRMAPLTEVRPKPILPICNRALIEHQIDMLRSIGIRDVFVVIGHKGYEIAKLLGDGSSNGVRIRYVEQTDLLGLAFAVGHLEPYIHTPFLLMLGDIFFVPDELNKMVDAFWEQQSGAILAVKEESEKELVCRNFAVVLSPEGLVTRVIEKPRYAPSQLKGIGLYLFDLHIFDAIRRTPRTALRDEYELTESVQVLINDGYPVRVSACIREDVNLTYPEDLLRCNLLSLEEVPSKRLIHESARMPDGTVVENSVIGPNVVISHPIRITSTLVLSDTIITTNDPLKDMIIGPDGFVDCRRFLP